MTDALRFLGWFTTGRLLFTVGAVLAAAWLQVLWGYRRGHVEAPPRWYMVRPPEPDLYDLAVLNREYGSTTSLRKGALAEPAAAPRVERRAASPPRKRPFLR